MCSGCSEQSVNFYKHAPGVQESRHGSNSCDVFEKKMQQSDGHWTWYHTVNIMWRLQGLHEDFDVF